MRSILFAVFVLAIISASGGAVLANALGVPDSEYQALMTIYESTNGVEWSNNTNWLTNYTPWQGVTVEDGHVVAIYLYNNHLNGTLPPQIGNLTNLTYLVLGCNSLSGPIPPSIGNLTNLTSLHLWSNQFSGAIPPEIGNLTNLAFLGLSDNQFSSAIPPEIGRLSKLEYLDLGSNQLSGPIPLKLGNLRKLDTFSLGGNQLTGEIPAQFGTLSNLQYLNLNQNKFSGPLPSIMFTLPKLSFIDLSNNHFTGNILNQIITLPELRVCIANNNQFSGNIPSSIANMHGLTTVTIDGNNYTGVVPPEITTLTQLTCFGIHWNGLVAQSDSVKSYLDQHCFGWSDTQTVAPSNVTVGDIRNGRVQLSWTPICFNWNGGCYEIGFSANPGGPYTFLPGNRTQDKYTDHITVTGLPDLPTVYLVVRTLSLPHPGNENTLVSSPLSAEVPAFTNTPEPFAKSLPDGTYVKLDNVIVTAVWQDDLYVENQNRAYGIHVVKSGHGVTSGTVAVSGFMRTDSNQERYIEADSIVVTGTGSVMSLGMPNKSVGGSDTAGQIGRTDGLGLNNVGLLVRTTGRVTDSVAFGRAWNMDTDPGWTFEGDWAWGVPTGQSGEFGGADPSSGKTGSSVVGYNLNGDYQDNLWAPLYATTPAVNCSGQTGVRLRFWRWLGIEAAWWDNASVEVSTDRTNWSTVWEHNGPDLIETAWTYQEIDISALADNQPSVYVRWAMGPTDVWFHYCGWNIDDVQVGELMGGRITIDDGSGCLTAVSMAPGGVIPSVGDYVSVTGVVCLENDGVNIKPLIKTREISDTQAYK